MGYKIARRAARDIVEIYGRGAADFGPEQAERYHQGLVETFNLLAANPRIAGERREIDPPVRLHPHQAHMIAYVEDGGEILIVRILHGRQDWERYLS